MKYNIIYIILVAILSIQTVNASDIEYIIGWYGDIAQTKPGEGATLTKEIIIPDGIISNGWFDVAIINRKMFTWVNVTITNNWGLPPPANVTTYDMGETVLRFDWNNFTYPFFQDEPMLNKNFNIAN